MIARTKAAGRSPGPLSEVPKNGNQPRLSLSQLAIGRIAGITTKMPHRPNTTLGIAANMSIIVRKTSATRGGRKSCVRKIATVSPKKPPISKAMSELVERPPNLRENAEFFFRYVPIRGCQKPEVIFVDRRQCLAADLPQDVGHQ